jgi:hypothetical protein
LIGVLQSRSEGFAGGDKTPQFLTLSVARDRYVLTEEYIEDYVVVASFARLANAQRALKRMQEKHTGPLSNDAPHAD